MDETQVIRVHYWAAARAAAGMAEESVAADALTLSELRDELTARHPGSTLPDVLAVCSVLVGDQPVSSADPGAVVVRAGDTVEFLPPFAGG